MKRLRASLVVASLGWLLASAPAAHASQGSCVLPTTGLVAGLTLVNDINACNSALLSLYSGATAPASPTTGMLWYSTTTNYIQQYDGTSWLNLWYVDASNHLTTWSIGGGIVTATVAVTGGVTIDVGSVPQSYITATGGGAITSFGSSAQVGSIHVIKLPTITLVHNATSLILPGAANIVTAPGDVAIAIYLGSGNWRVLSYTYATGQTITGTLSVTGFGLFGTGININGGTGNGAGGIWSQANYGTIFSAGRASPSLYQFAFFDSTIGVNYGGFDSAGNWTVPQGAILASASTTARPSFRAPTGVAPTSPVDGDIWNDGTNANIRIGSSTLAFGINFATKTDQQTGTSAVKAVAPLHQQDHKSALKVHCLFEGRPTASLLGGYGCASISRTAAGQYTITFSTAFANTTYDCVAVATDASTVYFGNGTRNTTTIQVNTVNLGSTPIGADAQFNIHCAGDQ
jgi:hypothetical protein